MNIIQYGFNYFPFLSFFIQISLYPIWFSSLCLTLLVSSLFVVDLGKSAMHGFELIIHSYFLPRVSKIDSYSTDWANFFLVGRLRNWWKTDIPWSITYSYETTVCVAPVVRQLKGYQWMKMGIVATSVYVWHHPVLSTPRRRNWHLSTLSRLVPILRQVDRCGVSGRPFFSAPLLWYCSMMWWISYGERKTFPCLSYFWHLCANTHPAGSSNESIVLQVLVS